MKLIENDDGTKTLEMTSADALEIIEQLASDLRNNPDDVAITIFKD